MGGMTGALPVGAPDADGTGTGRAKGGCPGPPWGAEPPGGKGLTEVSTPSVERLLFRKSVSASPEERSSEATAWPGGNSEK